MKPEAEQTATGAWTLIRGVKSRRRKPQKEEMTQTSQLINENLHSLWFLDFSLAFLIQVVWNSNSNFDTDA